MAGLGYKDFTAGAVLTAAQVDGYLMEQSVMNFAGTAARGSALASVLSAGQMAHVGGGTVTVYDGSAWQQVYPAQAGLVFVAGTAFSAVSSVSVNNCFTSTYDNYRVELRSVGSVDSTLTIRWRASGSDNSTQSYYNQGLYSNNNVAAAQGVTETGFNANVSDRKRRFLAFDVSYPQLADRTIASGISVESNDLGPGLFVTGSVFQNTNQFDGLSVIASTGNITGTIRVYGYRNS